MTIDRRRVLFALSGMIASAPASCFAQAWPAPRYVEPWKKIPSIVVMSGANEEGLAAVQEAVAFWNGAFVSIGSSFRLGGVARSTETIPDDELIRLRTVRSGETLDRISRLDGDIFVALSRSLHHAFMVKTGWVMKAVVVVGGFADLALEKSRLPSVIAHELGHAIGLDHNQDVSSLMCDVARCRPESMNLSLLPLSRADKLKILEMYPPGWRPEPLSYSLHRPVPWLGVGLIES